MASNPTYEELKIRVQELEEAESRRKQAELLLQESEERFRAYMDNSPTVAWAKDEQGRLVYLNKTYEDRFGIKLEDRRGKTDFELWPPEVAAEFVKNDQAVLTTGRTVEITEQTPNPDGSSCTWWNFKFSFRDASGRRYVGGVGVDITERKRAEDALRESEERFHSIFAQSLAGIEIYDAGGRLTDINRACMEIFGVESMEVVRGFDLFSDPSIPPGARKLLERGEAVSYETVFDFELVRARGLYATDRSGQCFLNCIVTPLRAPDRSITGYLVHVQDVTDRKRAEEALAEEHKRLQKALDDVRTLRGIVPICSSCKKIRDDKGYWKQVENYLTEHSEAQFSHGICPDCMKKFYPEFSTE